MMSDKQFKELIQKLDTLIKLTAMTALSRKTQKDQIKILSGLGLQPKEIAFLLGTTPLTVSVTKSKLKRKKSKVKKKKSESIGKEKEKQEKV